MLYGDYDSWLLPKLKRSSNVLVGSFHQPVSQLENKSILEKLVAQLDAIILVSRSQLPFFQGLVPFDRIFVVPHGIDTSFFAPRDGTRKSNIVITVGAHLRDFQTLGSAMSRVWRNHPDVHFVAVGTGGVRPLMTTIEKDKRLEIVEHASDHALRNLYQSASVAIFALQDATANNAILEAMACGVPIVATKIGGVPEYTDDGLAILCPPQDPEALANGIGELLTDRERTARKSTASRLRALNYDYQIVAEQMRKVYVALLGE